MPSKLKRPSLGRLLASLRPPPSRAGSPSSFPVQTGFPTSIADLVVKNHGRLKKPRKQRSPTATLAPPPYPPPVTLTVAAEELPLSPPTQTLSPVAVHRLDTTPRAPQGADVFRLRLELLALGGAVALALLAVWSEVTVAAFTVAALSLLWIESASRRRRLRPRPAETEALLDSCGRGPVSPIRVIDEAPRMSSCSDSDKGSEAPSPRTAERRELAAAGDDPANPKRKGKRTLRKLISIKLQKKPKSKDSGGEAEQPDATGGDTEPATPEAPVPSSEQTPSESSTEWSSSSEAAVVVVDGRGAGKFPLAAFVPVILAGLAAGKLPATALAVLCIVFSSAVQRL